MEFVSLRFLIYSGKNERDVLENSEISVHGGAEEKKKVLSACFIISGSELTAVAQVFSLGESGSGKGKNERSKYRVCKKIK